MGKLDSTSASNLLFMLNDAALVVFRFLDLPADSSQCLFKVFGGLFAIRAFESHSFNLNVSNWRHCDFDGFFHVFCFRLNRRDGQVERNWNPLPFEGLQILLR
jgi:hypothetical protein